MKSRSGNPTSVSLFTGAGGLDIGLELSGFETVAALDSETDAIETLKLNQAKAIPIGIRAGMFLSDTMILHSKIEEIESSALRPSGAGRRWVPDLLVGGPPCQPFSSAGHQKSVNDPRGRLFEEFVRVAEELRPRMILFENVRGLVTARGPQGDPGEALALVKDAFERIGYATTFSLLNAADYGVPQRRVRLFMMACRIGVLPSFPAPTHAQHPVVGLFGTPQPWVTLGDFLAGREEPDPEDVERPSPALRTKLARVPHGSGLKSAGAREATRPGGHWGYKQGTFIADPSKPARTVTAAATQDWIRVEGQLRRLTWRECAAIQGFPKEWEFVGRRANRFRQIGNAVPVIFGLALGNQMREALDKNRRKRAMSAPLPLSFRDAIDYTAKEQRRNGESRKAARAALARDPSLASEVKGLGSADTNV